MPLLSCCRRYLMVLAGSAAIALSASSAAFELRTRAQDSSPKYYLEDGRMSGLCVDIMKAVEAVEPALRFRGYERFHPKSRLEDELAHGEIDVFFGMIRTAKREKKFTFIDVPLYPTETRLAVRRSDPIDVTSLNQLKGMGKDDVILVVHGTAHADFLAQQADLAIDDGASTTEHNIRKLLAGRARFIYHTDLALADELKRHKLGRKIRVLPLIVKSEPQYLAVANTVPADVVDRLRNAMETLQKTGELARLRSYYLQLD